MTGFFILQQPRIPMTSITSRRHPLKYYLTLIASTLFFLALAAFMFFLFIQRINQGITKPKDNILPTFGTLVLAFAVYNVYQYVLNSPKVIINAYNISFNAEVLALSDIENIEFTGKHLFPYLFAYQMEGTALLFKDGSKRIIVDDMYQNSWELKLYLKHYVSDGKRIPPHQPGPIVKGSLENEHFDVFKDNQFISLRGISFWGMTVALIYGLIKSNKLNIGSVLFLIFYLLLWLILHGWMMHYFKLSERYLVIVNHLLPWKKHVYKLNDISEIVFETQQRRPNCLRVIGKDFKTKLYPAGTLHRKTWLDLEAFLTRHGINVRNELHL